MVGGQLHIMYICGDLCSVFHYVMPIFLNYVESEWKSKGVTGEGFVTERYKRYPVMMKLIVMGKDWGRRGRVWVVKYSLSQCLKANINSQ